MAKRATVQATVREEIRPFIKGGTHECVHYLVEGIYPGKVLVLTLSPGEVEVSLDKPGAPFHGGEQKGTVEFPCEVLAFARRIIETQQTLNGYENCLRRNAGCW
jgi:hypothetical protein